MEQHSTVGRPTGQLDLFFPFDPYLLPLSAHHIEKAGYLTYADCIGDEVRSRRRCHFLNEGSHFAPCSMMKTPLVKSRLRSKILLLTAVLALRTLAALRCYSAQFNPVYWGWNEFYRRSKG